MAATVAAPEENELPDAYGRSRVALLPIDPYHVHVYWEVTPEDGLRAAEQLGTTAEAPRWILRFYDVTFVNPSEASERSEWRARRDGGLAHKRPSAHGSFDVPIELGARNWYVDLWSAGKSYVVELGLLAGDRFGAVCRSSAAETPRAGPSSSYEPQWAAVSASPQVTLRVEPAPDPEPPRPAPQPRPDAPAPQPHPGAPALQPRPDAPALQPRPDVLAEQRSRAASGSEFAARVARAEREPSRSTSLGGSSSSGGPAG